MALPHDGGKHEKIINVIGIYLAERRRDNLFLRAKK